MHYAMLDAFILIRVTQMIIEIVQNNKKLEKHHMTKFIKVLDMTQTKSPEDEA